MAAPSAEPCHTMLWPMALKDGDVAAWPAFPPLSRAAGGGSDALRALAESAGTAAALDLLPHLAPPAAGVVSGRMPSVAGHPGWRAWVERTCLQPALADWRAAVVAAGVSLDAHAADVRRAAGRERAGKAAASHAPAVTSAAFPPMEAALTAAPRLRALRQRLLDRFGCLVHERRLVLDSGWRPVHPTSDPAGDGDEEHSGSGGEGAGGSSVGTAAPRVEGAPGSSRSKQRGWAGEGGYDDVWLRAARRGRVGWEATSAKLPGVGGAAPQQQQRWWRAVLYHPRRAEPLQFLSIRGSATVAELADALTCPLLRTACGEQAAGGACTWLPGGGAGSAARRSRQPHPGKLLSGGTAAPSSAARWLVVMEGVAYTSGCGGGGGGGRGGGGKHSAASYPVATVDEPLPAMQAWLQRTWPHSGWPRAFDQRSAAASTVDEAAPLLGAHYLAAHWQPPGISGAADSGGVPSDGHLCEHLLLFVDWALEPAAHPPDGADSSLDGGAGGGGGAGGSGTVACEPGATPPLSWSCRVSTELARRLCVMCRSRAAAVCVSHHPWLLSERAYLCHRCGTVSGITRSAGSVVTLACDDPCGTEV